ncbi:MAG: tetratricopeptide repeat protein [Fimbriimonadaceae bacterium]
MPTPASRSGNAEDTNYPELARANLARLRGDYDMAEAQCMALLKESPHNSTVAALLGDVSAEQGKLDEAIQWYEMAVDAGAPTGIEEKLTAMRARVKERDVARAEQDIGLTQRTWASPPVIVGTAVIILMLLVCAYVAGTYRTPVKVAAPPPYQAPIVLPSTTPSPPAQVVNGTSDPGVVDAPHQTPSGPIPDSTASMVPTAKASFDPDLQPYFENASGILSRVTSAVSDPRNHAITVAVPLQGSDDPRTLAAQVAQATLTAIKDPTVVTVRVLSGGKPILLADCTRDKFDAFTREDHPATDTAALADGLLSNEWRDASFGPQTGR